MVCCTACPEVTELALDSGVVVPHVFKLFFVFGIETGFVEPLRVEKLEWYWAIIAINRSEKTATRLIVDTN